MTKLIVAFRNFANAPKIVAVSRVLRNGCVLVEKGSALSLCLNNLSHVPVLENNYGGFRGPCQLKLGSHVSGCFNKIRHFVDFKNAIYTYSGPIIYNTFLFEFFAERVVIK